MYARTNAPQISIEGVSPTPQEEEVLGTIIQHWCALVGDDAVTDGNEDDAQPATFNDITLRRLVAYHRSLGIKVILSAMERAVERKGRGVALGYVMTSLANHNDRPRYTTDILKRIQAASGRKGGQSTSDAKVAAAKVNGAKGGRPRKGEAVPTVDLTSPVDDEDVHRFDDDAPSYVAPAASVEDDDPELAKFDDEPKPRTLAPARPCGDGWEYECRCGEVHYTDSYMVAIGHTCTKAA